MGLDHIIGNFAVGKAFDALIIDPDSGVMDTFPQDTALELFQKFLLLGDDRNIQSVFVNGVQVK